MDLFRDSDLFRVYAIVFLADITIGIVIPTFPLYAESIGASVFLLSIVVTGMGIARILSQVYLGALADAKGRKIDLFDDELINY